MNCLLTQIPQGMAWPTISAWREFTLLAARNSEGDDTIWVQMLVIVILAVFLGIFSLARAKANKSKVENLSQSRQKFTGKTLDSRKGWLSPLSGAARLSVEAKAKTEAKSEDLHKKREKNGPSHPAQAVPKRTSRDLQSGMELLGQDFLLKVVENTNDGDDEKDVAIRKLNFKELLRRGELSQADSKALKKYAINKGNLYGKDIQCEAMKSLAERTAKGKTGN